VISVFLRSLAENWNGKLIAVIVSGYDGDGADALRAIRDIGGVAIAQKLETAGKPDMPESAIASGCVDLILSPEGIAHEIGPNSEGRTGAAREALTVIAPTRDLPPSQRTVKDVMGCYKRGGGPRGHF
jgi:CheB methylesterase